jgi:hypothetical protein
VPSNKKQSTPPPKRKKKAKRLEVEAAAVARGTEIGKAQAHKKKSLIESTKEHIGRMIDNTSLLDVAAVTAGTVLIHGIIHESAPYAAAALKYAKLWTHEAYVELVSDIFKGTAGEKWGVKAPKDNPEEWISAFFIAFILVKNGGQIIGLLGSSLSAIVGLMLA